MPVEAGAALVQAALVIDDEEVARYLVRKTLASLGYRVREASDGAAGIESAREHRPDLIVLDLMMPDLDGFAVLEELKGDSLTAGIPVVVQTAKRITPDELALLATAAAAIDKRDAGQGSLAAAIESLSGIAR